MHLSFNISRFQLIMMMNYLGVARGFRCSPRTTFRRGQAALAGSDSPQEEVQGSRCHAHPPRVYSRRCAAGRSAPDADERLARDAVPSGVRARANSRATARVVYTLLCGVVRFASEVV